MGRPRINRFDPGSASRADLVGYHELVLATGRVDRPDEQPPPFEAAVGRLFAPMTARGPELFWSVRVDQRLVGMATVGLPDDENAALAMTDIRVHPDARRAGLGTALLAAAMPTMRARHRSTVVGWGVTAGGAGALWAEALGFEVVHHGVLQVLALATADPARWVVPVPAGYRVHGWVGSAPEELLASYADARTAIHHAPRGASSYRPPLWTPARVRAAEADLRARRVEQRVVVTVQVATGAVVALTEVELHGNRPDLAYQGDTAVLPAHRGHGLGRLIKSRMIRWLRRECPAVQRIGTSTAASNVHMIRINHQVGYQTTRHMVDVEADVEALAVRLAGRN